MENIGSGQSVSDQEMLVSPSRSKALSSLLAPLRSQSLDECCSLIMIMAEGGGRPPN